MNKNQKAWAVYANTDGTEGRGWDVPIHICKTEATAIRLAKGADVMGSNAKVVQVNLVVIDGIVYGPVYVRAQTKADIIAQKEIDTRRTVEARAKAAGLSDDDLAILKSK